MFSINCYINIRNLIILDNRIISIFTGIPITNNASDISVSFKRNIVYNTSFYNIPDYTIADDTSDFVSIVVFAVRLSGVAMSDPFSTIQFLISVPTFADEYPAIPPTYPITEK